MLPQILIQDKESVDILHKEIMKIYSCISFFSNYLCPIFKIEPKIAFQSGKWKKWLLDDSSERWNKQVEGLFKATICGHYVFNNSEIKAMRDDLNIEQKCKEEIKKNILVNLNEFGWNI